MTALDRTYENLLGRLLELGAEIAERTTEADDIKAQLRNLGAGEYTVNGRPTLKLIPNRRFDLEGAYALVPEPRRKECLTVNIDPAKVKSLLTPEQLDAVMVEHGQLKVVPQ